MSTSEDNHLKKRKIEENLYAGKGGYGPKDDSWSAVINLRQARELVDEVSSHDRNEACLKRTMGRQNDRKGGNIGIQL